MGLFSKKKKNENGELGEFNVKHVLGLEIPEGMYCEVTVYKDNLIIEVANKEFNLKIDKVNSVDFDMNLDIEKYAKSNMVKGIAGATMFGIAGAVIGSAPKTKERRIVTSKAIINYETSSGDTAYIIFEDAEPNVAKGAAKLVDTLRLLIKNKENIKIEL